MKAFVHRMRLAAMPLALAPLFHPHASFAQQQPAPLAPVVVNATRFAEPADTLPLGVSVITADDIRASGATTVTEALMRLAGVQGRQDFYGGGEYNLDLRGFGGTADNNQLVILDGQRLSEADLGGTRIAGIPIESVERIEVLRGSGAVLYGEGATGGVIVITTKAGTARHSGASAYVAAGSYGLRDARASGTFASGGFSLDANLQQRNADNHRDNFRSELQAGSLKGQWANDWLRVGAGFSQDDLDARLPGAISFAQYQADPSRTNHPNDWATIRNTRANAFAQADVAGWELAADIGERKKALRSDNSGFPYDYDVDAHTASVRARNLSPIGGVKNQFVAGYDYSQWQRDVLGAFGSTATQHARAWYAKDDVILASGTRITLGARTESIDKNSGGVLLDDRQQAWELGASHPFASGLTGYARIGRSYRLANVDEFNYTSPAAILQPQVSRDAELGVRWSHAGGRAEARVYRSNLTNEIGFDPNATGPFGFPGANVNFDPTRRQGLEVDVVQSVTSTFGVRANAAVRSATFRSGPYSGNTVPLVARETVSLRADWAPLPGHRVTGGVNWVSSQQVDFNNTCKVPASTTADARYAFTFRQAELSVGVTNLFDHKYFTQAFGCAGAVPAAVYPEPGRAFTAALRVWM